MKRYAIISVCFILLLLGGSLVFFTITEKLFFRSPVLIHRNAVITFALGEASFRENPKREWQNALVGTTLKPGFSVKTGAKSIVDLKFHSGMAIRIAEKSECIIDESTVKKVTLNLTGGALYGTFEKLYKEHNIKVRTPTITASIRGTDLAFETGMGIPDVKKEEPEPTDADSKDEPDISSGKVKTETEPVPNTTVYALTGITEIVNPEFSDQKVLLAYQKKITVYKGMPPGQISEISNEDSIRLVSILNSIHFEEVLLISDKILFKSGSYKLLGSSGAELDRITEILKKKKVTVRIIGHTDNVGGTASNQKLSLKRAEAIRRYIVSKGIDGKRLLTAGFGESKPIAENTTRRGRALNRRVEFTIVKD